jgi:hypothetical protein
LDVWEGQVALTIEAEDEEAGQEEQAALMIVDVPFKKEEAYQKEEAFKKQEDFRKREVAGDVACFVEGAFRMPTQQRGEEDLVGLVGIMKAEDEHVADFVEEGGINGLARQ